MAREAAERAFDKAAQALNEDWNIQLDGKQIQRWGERLGRAVQQQRDAEVIALDCGRSPAHPPQPVKLLVLGLDGGRVQMREPNPETGNRWREDKIVTLSSYLPGDGAEQDPQKLVTTTVATLGETQACGRLARVEAERRGWEQAEERIALADCGNWIDPLLERDFGKVERIADWSHAEEHLHDCGRALHGADVGKAKAFSEPLVSQLYEGGVKAVIAVLRKASEQLGKPAADDGPEHPRRILAQNVGYFERNQNHMNYPEYLRKGWPIGSGNTEAGVKQFNKRVKGTEQFWHPDGLEAILCLRGLWISQDDRWTRYWSTRPAYLRRPA